MTQVTKYAIMTSVDKDSTPVRTVIEVDFEGFTLEDAKTMFFKSTSPRVAVQSKLRNVKEGIPARWQCKATDFAKFGAGAGERIMTTDELVAAAQASPEVMTALKKSLGLS